MLVAKKAVKIAMRGKDVKLSLKYVVSEEDNSLYLDDIENPTLLAILKIISIKKGY